jgi:transposase InsO family protein
MHLRAPEALVYKDLEEAIFVDPINKRVYKVSVVFYDPVSKVVAAFRQVLDDDPADPLDRHPWRVEGPRGIAELVEDYRITGAPAYAPLHNTPWPTSEEGMLEVQRRDPNLQNIIEYLLADPNPDHSYQYSPKKHFYLVTLENGQRGALRLLNETLVRMPSDRVVVPDELVPHILRFYHDDQAHPGRERTAKTIQSRYWWKDMLRDIETYTHSCKYCRKHKAHNHVARVPIQQYHQPAYPFERVHIDLTGPFNETSRGNKYILVVKDALTRYVEVHPIKNKEPISVAKVLVDQIYCRHGAIGTLISDRGGEFLNNLCDHVSALLQIRRVCTTPHNPRSNGSVETFNHTLKDMLSNYVTAFQDDWDIHLPTIAFAYNTTVCTQTGFTPFKMIFGREARQPLEDWITRYQHETENLETYVKQLIQALQYTWDYAAAKRDDEVKEYNRVPIRRLEFKEFEVGDKFFLKIIPDGSIRHWSDPKKPRSLSPKLQHRWTGPFVVTKKFSPVHYEALVHGVSKHVHAISMQHYREIV